MPRLSNAECGPRGVQSQTPQGKDAGLKPKTIRSTITTTPESIVRDFRKVEGVISYKDLESMRPIFRPLHRAFFLKRWINVVNWQRVFDLACIGAVIGCLIYLGIFVFAPFTAKLIR